MEHNFILFTIIKYLIIQTFIYIINLIDFEYQIIIFRFLFRSEFLINF